MDRLVSIILAGFVGLFVYSFFRLALRKNKFKDFCKRNVWLHPNPICYWRPIVGWIGLGFYFYTPYFTTGIVLFTVSAMLDGVDGMVARSCNLITELGKIIDPLSDKLTYLPAMLIFGIREEINLIAVLIFIAIEIIGQFGIRYIIKKLGLSVAANNYGKVKAFMCFTLIIYCALLENGIAIPDFSNLLLYACIIAGLASIIFKFDLESLGQKCSIYWKELDLGKTFPFL